MSDDTGDSWEFIGVTQLCLQSTEVFIKYACLITQVTGTVYRFHTAVFAVYRSALYLSMSDDTGDSWQSTSVIKHI